MEVLKLPPIFFFLYFRKIPLFLNGWKNSYYVGLGKYVTQKLCSPLGECQDQKHSQGKEWEKGGFLYITATKENTKDLSQSSISLNRKIWEVLT